MALKTLEVVKKLPKRGDLGNIYILEEIGYSKWHYWSAKQGWQSITFCQCDEDNILLPTEEAQAINNAFDGMLTIS